jgi:hypothetical protein
MTHIINSIGLEVFGVISICLFAVVFSATIIGSLCLKRPFLKRMGALPLEDDGAENADANQPSL